jgi:hypothetical protein
VQRAHKKGLGEMGGQEAGNGPKFSFHFISSFGTLRDVVRSTRVAACHMFAQY